MLVVAPTTDRPTSQLSSSPKTNSNFAAPFVIDLKAQQPQAATTTTHQPRSTGLTSCGTEVLERNAGGAAVAPRLQSC